MTVVHEDNPDKFTVVPSRATEVGARATALDEDSGTLYLITAKAGPTVILSFLLEIFYPLLHPAVGRLAGLSVFLALIFLIRAANRAWGRRLLRGWPTFSWPA